MNEKAASLLEAARRELARKKTKKAVKLINEAVAADPDAHEILAERAAIAISPMRAYRGAVDDAARAIEMAPDVGNYYDLRGQAYWYLREYERAYADFNKAIEVDPDCARAYYHRANFSEKLQRYEDAIADMKRAVELDFESTSYRHRLDEIKRAAVRHAERIGVEPPAAALEEAPSPPEPVEPEAPPEEEAAEAPAKAPAEEAPPEPGPLPVAPVAPVAPTVSKPKPGEVADQWSVRIPSGERFGPVSMALLKLWAYEQRVKPGDKLMSPKGAWVTASTVPDLAPIFEDLRTTKKPPVRPD